VEMVVDKLSTAVVPTGVGVMLSEMVLLLRFRVRVSGMTLAETGETVKASTKVSAWARERELIRVAVVGGGVKLCRVKDRVSSEPAGRLVAVQRRAVTPGGRLPVPLGQGVQVTVAAARRRLVVELARMVGSVV